MQILDISWSYYGILLMKIYIGCSRLCIEIRFDFKGKRAYAGCPSYDMNLVMGDANAKVGREIVHQPTIGKHSLHESTNENGLTLGDFAAGRQMAIKITYFMHERIHLQTWHSRDGHTFNQIDHCLIDGRHFSDVIDGLARRGANIDSDHMLVVIKLRAKICRASNATD
jgi:hypothetical protein